MVIFFRRQAPYQLNRGLFLEKSGTLVPWDSKVQKLRELGTPKFTTYSDRTRGSLFWDDEQIFDGVSVSVEYNSGGLENTFVIGPKNLKDFASPREAFAHFRDTLTLKLGEPRLSERVQYGFSYPAAVWWFGKVRVSIAVAERFMDYLAFMVTKGIGKP